MTDVAHQQQGIASTLQALRFEDLHLPLGARLTIQQFDGEDDLPHMTWLCGVIEDVSLIIQNPVSEGGLVVFRAGDPLLVKTFAGTSMFAFAANVLAVHELPTPYLHVEYPRRIDGVVIRAQRRVAVNIAVETYPVVRAGASVPSSGLGLPARIRDLSSSGARMTSRVSLGDVGDEFGIRFRVATELGEVVYRLRAIVRTTTVDAMDGFCHGVQFEHDDPIMALALEGLVVQIKAPGRLQHELTRSPEGAVALRA